MLKVIGDSHSNSFRGWGIGIRYLGAITLKRVTLDENLWKKINRIWGKKYLVFGEIDVRCHQIDENLIISYVGVASRLNCGIIGITPPARRERAERFDGLFRITKTDSERAELTKRLNEELKRECAKREVKFLDLSSYADEEGILKEEFSDGTVHIKDKNLKRLLRKNIRGF